MYIEKINEDKIRIILNIDDLAERNIDLHSFMSTSFENQELFLNLLKEAEHVVGFKTYDHKLIIEALFSSNGNFIFTITKLSQKDKFLKKVNIEAKPKINIMDINLSIYKFKSFDDICDFCKYLFINNFSTYSENLKSTLYKIDNTYFLVLENINLDLKIFNFFSSIVLEFADYIHNPNLFYYKIKEFGSPLIYNNALKTIITYF